MKKANIKNQKSKLHTKNQNYKKAVNSILSFLIFGFWIFINSSFAQITSNITSLLSSEGKVLFGNEPNSILVIDYPDNIAKIENYLQMVDVEPRQVLIEARVVEVKLQGESAMGVNWSAFADRSGVKMGQFRIGGATGTSLLQQNIPFKPTFFPPGTTDSQNQETTPFTITIFDENINLVLQALANNFDTNILSAPRITTVNNRQALIKVVTELRWVVPQLTVDEGGTVTIVWDEADDSPRSVGISLPVMPIITEDGQISLELKPEVSEHVRDIELTAIAGTSQVPYTIPIIDSRSTDTKVIIRDGQTLIIGGLIKEKNIKGATKVPFFGDLPFLGWAFKSKKDTRDKSELLIFVSPTIITPGVVARMEKDEKSIWYKKEREKGEKDLIREEKNKEKKFVSELNSLENKVNNLTVKRKNLEREMAVTKENK